MSNISARWESLREQTLWDPTRKPIYDAITNTAEPVEDSDLPDDSLHQKGQDLRFVPGARDALLRRPEDKSDNPLKDILAFLKTALDRPSAKKNKALYDSLAATTARDFAPAFCQSLAELSDQHTLETAELFRYFARNAPDREVVKIAIAVIGFLGTTADEDLLSTLGRHNEFTNLACNALLIKAADPEHSVWALSKQVNGWGRVHTVEKLASTKNEAIKHWLVRDGYKNTIMYGYLAGIAVRTGDLIGQLQTDTPDDALLDGTADILSALVFGGPCPDISEYPEAVIIYELFLKHNKAQDVNLKRLSAIAQVTKFLIGPSSKRRPPPKYWSRDQIANGITDGLKILEKPSHVERIKTALKTGTEFEANRANLVAKALDLDLWDITFQRALKSEDINLFVLLDICERHRMLQIIAWVEDIAPLSEIATGPTNALFPKHNKRNHEIIDLVVQNLRRFPGLGWKILNVALRSPVVRTRNMAISALNKWPRADWPEKLETTLQQAINEEPNPEVKTRLEALAKQTMTTGQL